MRERFRILGAVGLAAAAWWEPAAAAVRLCKHPVTSGLVVRPSEEDARREAMAAWKAEALQFGEPYASWRIAADKLFECLPHKDGGFECVAKGTPCTIEHAPDRRHLRENRIEM